MKVLGINTGPIELSNVKIALETAYVPGAINDKEEQLQKARKSWRKLNLSFQFFN